MGHFHVLILGWMSSYGIYPKSDEVPATLEFS